MSKKKATMTLKDFHGGSIPSDLPLPSAPGLTVRPMDRPVFDRPNPWGNPMGRPDHRSRPGSAGSVRNNFDDKSPFLGPNAHIGRNFDEDERKPLDGGYGPRSIRPEAFPTRSDVAKPDYSVSSRQPAPPSQQFSGAGSNSYAGRVSEPAVPKGSGPFPNAWNVRKEAMVVADVAPATWTGQDAASKLAHASALDKVSSGRWQSNKQQTIQHLENIEPVIHSDVIGDVAIGMEYLTVNEGRGGEKVISFNEKARSTNYPGKSEDLSVSSIFVGSTEQSERPKLKLLPRSKPLDGSEQTNDYNLGYYQTQNSEPVHQVTKSYETANNTKSGLIVADSGNLPVDRPKLNLKPRSQALEKVKVTTEKGRSTVFGGARPRELVLKERGVDDIIVNNHDVAQSPNRVKLDLPRIEIAPQLHSTPSRYIGKPEFTPLDNRAKKNNDTRDNRVDAERTDTQKRNWRSENQRNNTSVKQPPQDRPPSPDTWRKPVEEPRPASSDGTGMRYGKAASAVELAQAFSKSVSDPKTVDRIPNQKGIPRTGQIPFSRLTDPASRPQINGY